MTTTDQALARRRVLLSSFLLGWMCWYGYLVLSQTGLQESFGFAINIIIAAAGMLGWAVFVVSLIKILNIRKRYKDNPEALAALQDDLQKAQNERANRYGVFALLGTQILLVGAGDVFGWSATVGAHLSIFIGVTAIIGSALILDMVE